MFWPETMFSTKSCVHQKPVFTKNHIFTKNNVFTKNHAFNKNHVFTKNHVLPTNFVFTENNVFTKPNVVTKSKVFTKQMFSLKWIDLMRWPYTIQFFLWSYSVEGLLSTGHTLSSFQVNLQYFWINTYLREYFSPDTQTDGHCNS